MSSMTNTLEQEEKEEVLHFMRVLNAFKAYRSTTLRLLESCENNYNSLSEQHKNMVPNHFKTIQDMKICVDFNAAVIKEITNFCSGMFENKKYKQLRAQCIFTMNSSLVGKIVAKCLFQFLRQEEKYQISEHVPFTAVDTDKVKSTLKQIVRDWSVDGAEERRLCYDPIISEITNRLPLLNKDTGTAFSVLVPGCGLGRLAWELARRGYHCQGNEFSFYMLFTSYFIINRTRGDSDDDFHQFTFYPWIGKRSNNLSWKDVLKPVQFPDVNPNSLPPDNKFSMAAGDFLEVYTQEGTWHCVACCFFIDTAHNIISFLERIYYILKPGGLFVNLGPLLYHFFGMAKESSIELSLEEVIDVIKQIGFKILKYELVKALYTNHCPSMLNYEYTCALIVAQKPVTG